MTHLSLSLLGSFQVTLDGQPVTGFRSNKTRALLAYLAVDADRPHRRGALAGLLWPDWSDRDALGNLRYTLSSLRQTICSRQADSSFLLVTRDSLQFNCSSDYWLDVETFSSLMEVDWASPTAVDQLTNAIALYRGSFLEGFSVSDSPAFDEWMLYTRERLARQVSSVLHFLAATCEKNGDYKQAQTHAWRQLELEPWDETSHQQMMRIWAFAGQRSAALAQYQTCCRVLAEELAVEPSQETTRLYEQIRDGKLAVAGPSPVSPAGRPVNLPAFLNQETSHAEQPVCVAREHELKQLDGFLEVSMSGQGQVAFVTGEAGSGKTCLLQEFARRAEETHTNLTVAGGDCNAYTGIGDPYLPFREILELLTGDIAAKEAAGAITRASARRLWQLLPVAVQALVESGPDLIDTFLPRLSLLERSREYAPDGANWLTRLEELLERKPSGGFIPPSPQQSGLFEQYTRVLQTLAQYEPLLLVLDDLQWADLGSISLLFHLGRRLTGNRILVVGAYRPEDVGLETDGKRHALEPVVNEFRRAFGDILVNVDQAEGQGFIDAFLDSEPNRLGQPFREMLYRQTRGHPLFTIELLRGLQARDDLCQDVDGHWIEGAALDWETLPARVEAAIRERIGRMPDELRRALTVACVEGEQFTAEVVARVRGISEREMLECLSGELDRHHRLVRAQSIRRLEGRLLSSYRFRHILFQKYLYSELDEVERAHLHEQVGRALEELYGTQEQAAAIAVQLALHFQKAGIIDKALLYLHQAGTKAVQLSAYLESRVHLTKAMDLLMTLPETSKRTEQELALQLALGMAWMGDIPGPEWENAITRARELCQQTGKTSELVLALGELAIFHYVRAEYHRARDLAEEALNLIKDSDDELLVALGHWHLGFILIGLGEYMEAREHLARVISVYEYKKHHRPFVLLRGSDPGVSAMAYDACCLWCLGYPDQAMERSRDALTLARELNHAFTLADVLCFGGCLFNMMAGDVQTLKEKSEELIRLSDGMGFTSFGGTGTCYLGYALARMGRAQEGLAQICDGLTMRQSIGAMCYLSGILGSLTAVQAMAGKSAEALATLAEALAFVEERDERHWEAELYRLQGELLLAHGNAKEAEISFMKAIEVAQHQQAKSWELRAVTSLGRLWQKQGKKAQAVRRLAEIYNWFTEGFDTPDLIEARKLLDELST